MRPGYFPYHHAVGWHLLPHLLGAGLMALLWLGLLGLLLWAVFRVIRGRPRWLAGGATWPPSTSSTRPASGLSATEILRQRYARGEIDTVTFQQMMERLQASAPSDEPDGSTFV